MKATLFILLVACLSFPFSAAAQEPTKYYIRIENEQGVVLDQTYESLEALRADADRLAEYGVTVGERGQISTRQQGGGRQSVIVQQYTGDEPPKRRAHPHHRRHHTPGGQHEHGFSFHFSDDSSQTAMNDQFRRYMEVIHERLDSLQGDAMVWVSGNQLDSLRERMRSLHFDQRQFADSMRQHAMQFRWKAGEQRAHLDSLRKQLRNEMEFMFDENGPNYFFYESDDADKAEMRVIRIENPEAGELKKAGIREKKALLVESLTIYPNPAHNALNVRFTTADESAVTLKVIDMQGKEVYSSRQLPDRGSYRHQLSMQGLAPGTYLLYLAQDNRQLYRKLIIE